MPSRESIEKVWAKEKKLIKIWFSRHVLFIHSQHLYESETHVIWVTTSDYCSIEALNYATLFYSNNLNIDKVNSNQTTSTRLMNISSFWFNSNISVSDKITWSNSKGKVLLENIDLLLLQSFALKAKYTWTFFESQLMY